MATLNGASSHAPEKRSALHFTFQLQFENRLIYGTDTTVCPAKTALSRDWLQALHSAWKGKLGMLYDHFQREAEFATGARQCPTHISDCRNRNLPDYTFV
jgi:hypothetical protein